MAASHHFTRVDFRRFKAFDRFTLHLRSFNILVGPNNAGKSTVLAAFRILAAAMRRASSRKPSVVAGPNGDARGHLVDLSEISVAQENLFFNYDDNESASVSFKISNGNELLLFFPSAGVCTLMSRSTRDCSSPGQFKREFNCPIGFVPVLGPVDQSENLFEKETARRALFNFNAARNFRNIWHHYPERFDAFREIVRQTWPGMDVEPPTVDYSHAKPRLHMLCPEDRIPREICWSGFGFQVWCQMLTHLVQPSDKSLFLIDEPDIYLHSDLQRQLLTLLRNMGPDVIIATHSTEIITEAEPDDIVLVDKRRQRGKRIQNPSQLGGVFALLGSNLNPILTQLAKTRRAVFVEGKDFQILSRFGQRLQSAVVSGRKDFAVVPVDGFNPQRIRNMKDGMEATLGDIINAACVLDRDYRSDTERDHIANELGRFADVVAIHNQKEIENFLLVPAAIDRAAAKKVADRSRRTGEQREYVGDASATLDEFAEEQRNYVVAQQLAARRHFERSQGTGVNETTYNEQMLAEFDQRWQEPESRLSLIPGKDALSFVNRRLQDEYSISVTPTGIIDAMHVNEIPDEIRTLVESLGEFAATTPDGV